MKDIEKLSELYVAQDVLQYKVKKGFEAFENRFVAVCDPTGNRLTSPPFSRLASPPQKLKFLPAVRFASQASLRVYEKALALS